MVQRRLSGRFLQMFLVLWVCMACSGCWILIVGGVGAVGGYAVSRDSFEGVTNKTQDELMDAAHKVLAIMGMITFEYPKSGAMQAMVYGNHVTVTVIQVNVNTSKLRVKARNGIFPRIGVAQEVYTKIMNQLQ